MTEQHTPFEQKVKSSLSHDTLDDTTQAQLRQARQAALQQPKASALTTIIADTLAWFSKPAGNVVLASVLAVVLILPRLAEQPSPYSDQGLNQTALLDLLDAPSAESLDESADPDFYLWLAEQDQSA